MSHNRIPRRNLSERTSVIRRMAERELPVAEAAERETFARWMATPVASDSAMVAIDAHLSAQARAKRARRLASI